MAGSGTATGRGIAAHEKALRRGPWGLHSADAHDHPALWAGAAPASRTVLPGSARSRLRRPRRDRCWSTGAKRSASRSSSWQRSRTGRAAEPIRVMPLLALALKSLRLFVVLAVTKRSSLSTQHRLEIANCPPGPRGFFNGMTEAASRHARVSCQLTNRCCGRCATASVRALLDTSTKGENCRHRHHQTDQHCPHGEHGKILVGAAPNG